MSSNLCEFISFVLFCSEHQSVLCIVLICAPPSLLKEFDSIGIGFWPGVSNTCGRYDHGGNGEGGHGGRR